MKQESTKKFRSFTYEIKKSDGIDYIIVKSSDGFKVTLTDLGASIYEIKRDKDFLTLTPKYVSDFKRKDVYHGKTIGRYANRIKDANIYLNGEHYLLDKNDNNNCLHSGRNGMHTKYFEYEITYVDDSLKIIFKYESPDLDAGFPGNMVFEVTYVFEAKFENFSMLMIHTAKTDKETLFRPTNHAYFTLGSFDPETFYIAFDNIDRVIMTDEELIPEKVVKLRPWWPDQKFVRLADVLREDHFKLSKTHVLDNYFLREKDEDSVMELRNHKYILDIQTNFMGFHLYDDNIEDGIIYKGTKEKNYRALAVEPCDSSLKKNNLKPGENYLKYAIYTFLINK